MVVTMVYESLDEMSVETKAVMMAQLMAATMAVQMAAMMAFL